MLPPEAAPAQAAPTRNLRPNEDSAEQTKPRRARGSSATYSLVDVRDGHNVIDWFPQDHPLPMPPIINAPAACVRSASSWKVLLVVRPQPGQAVTLGEVHRTDREARLPPARRRRIDHTPIVPAPGGIGAASLQHRQQLRRSLRAPPPRRSTPRSPRTPRPIESARSNCRETISSIVWASAISTVMACSIT